MPSVGSAPRGWKPRGGNHLRIWSWIRDVIADRGEHDPVPIYLERGDGDDYVYRLGVRGGFGRPETARLPAQRRPQPAPHPMPQETPARAEGRPIAQGGEIYT